MQIMSVVRDLFLFFRFWPLLIFLLVMGSSMCIGHFYWSGPVESAYDKQEREELEGLLRDAP